jgi:hypothetical protein
MNETQEMYKNMFKTVIQFSADTNSICVTRAGYIAGLTQLKQVVIDIEKSEGLQGIVTTGPTETRQTLYTNLTTQFLLVTNGAAGYAASINNDTLYNNFDKSDTDVERIGLAAIEAKTAQLIIDVTPYLIPLGTDWGVTSGVMDDLANALQSYTDDFAKPRQAIVNKDTQTQTVLPPLFTLGRKIMKRTMDKAAKTLKLTQSTWYSNYSFSKELITIHHEITTVKVLVTDSVSKNPIPYAKVTSPEEHISKNADLNGSDILSPFIPGDSTLLIEASGYHSKTIPPFHIKPGETLHFDVELDPL